MGYPLDPRIPLDFFRRGAILGRGSATAGTPRTDPHILTESPRHLKTVIDCVRKQCLFRWYPFKPMLGGRNRNESVAAAGALLFQPSIGKLHGRGPPQKLHQIG